YSYATGTKTATFNINVINPGDGTESNPYSVDEAIAFIDTLDGATSTNKIYVKGIVSSSTAVTTDSTGSYRDVYLFNKAGDADSFEFFRTYLDENLDGISDAANSIQYYEVVGCGYGTYYANNSTYELKSVKVDNVYDNVYLKSANAPVVISVEANIAAGTYYTGHTLNASDFSVTANFTNGKPSGTVTEGFTWTVNGVENGTLAEGTNSVIVYLGDKHSATISVTGTTTHATDLSLTESTKTVYIGTPVTLGIEVEPEGYVDTVVWESSDESVATVNQNGTVTGVSAGTADITAYITNVNGTMSDTCTVTVAADYVTSMGWSGTNASQFGPFYSNSGAQLTKAITDTWNVSATWQGKGTVENLKFGDYTLKLGDKTISTLPYTYVAEDDGQALKIVYGTASSGQSFEKGNGTAKPNIVQSLNTISREMSGSAKINNFVTESTITLAGVSGTGGDASANKNGVTITSNGGYFTNTQFRIYSGKTFTVNATGTIKTITLTFSGDYTGLKSSYTVNSNTFTDTTTKQARITTLVIEYEAGTQTVYFNDQTGHENTQRAVVRFATFLNETMGKDGICGTSIDNYGVHDSMEFASAWLDVAAKYDELFGSGENALKGDELAFAKNMLAGCEAKWNDSPDVLQRAMKTYDYVVTYYSAELIAEGMTTPNFMLDADGQTPLRAISTNGNGQLQLFGNSADSEMITVIVVMSAIATICAGGFFFYRRRKEQQ
ncbi:MAG: Ig-like domain-containing protein, partial [Bacilli bacterium]|nr:Ig-like domain-containing protein [Bacilli bacterium]